MVIRGLQMVGMLMGRVYPETPIPAVGAFILKDGKLLLVKRAYEPGAGKWTVPGGAIELGEKTVEALHREILEEVGIRLKNVKLLDIYDAIFRDEGDRIRYHYVIIEFLAEPETMEVKLSDEALDYRWVNLEEVEHLDLTYSVRYMIKKYWGLFREFGKS